MAFSKFLEARKGDAKELVGALGEYYEYVGLLGSDVTSLNVRANKRTSSVTDGSDTDRGFVLKLWSDGAFYEYSLDDIKGDKRALAKKIHDELTIKDERFRDRHIFANAPDLGEPLQKDFVRENDFDAYSAKDLLDFCVKMKDELLSRDERIVNAAALIRTMKTDKLFASATRLLTQSYTWVNGYLLVNFKDGKLISAREGADSYLLGDVMRALPQKVDTLVQKAAKLVKAQPIVPGTYDVITAPSVTGLLAHEAFGHGVEMDMFVKHRALAANSIGTAVASPICNMRDGAASTVSVASYFFDDDGVLAHDTQIIKNGVLMGGICDLASAAQLNVSPTGNGRRESHLRKAYSRMTNTFFEAGTDTLEDMIASIKHGYMIFETNNGMEDPKNWQVQCVAEYGREIVDGKLTDNYVSPVVMSGYVPDVLKSISMISRDVVIEGAGMCGKGHKEWVRVSDGGPALKLVVKLG